MRKYLAWFTLTICLICCLSACRDRVNSPTAGTSEVMSEESKQVSSTLSRAIVKDGNTIYSRADNCLKSYKLTEGSEAVLYEAPEKHTIIDYFIYNTYIYLLEYDNSDYFNPVTSLYLINKDGTGRKLLKDGLPGYEWQVYVYRKQLYLYQYVGHQCYSLNEDGTLGQQLPDQNTAYRFLSSDYQEIYNGKLLCAPYCLQRFGCIWAEDERRNLYRIAPEDGSKTTAALPEGCNTVMIADCYIISMKLSGENKKYYLTDIKTGESKLWFEGQEEYIDYDDKGCYFSNRTESEDGTGSYTYTKIAWDGTKSTLFTEEEVPGMYEETSEGITDFTVLDGSAYYHYADKDRMYLMCRQLNSPGQREELGSCYNNKMFSGLGYVKAVNKRYYASKKKDKDILRVYSERLIFNTGSKADKKINDRLKTLQKEEINTALATAKECESSFIDNSMGAFSLNSVTMGLTFLSDRYICIFQNGENYTGGAHGMPFREYFIFDLTTGEQLTLKDVVKNSDQEVHDIILKYFTDYIDKHPEIFLGTPEDFVSQTAGLNSPFYLTKDGIGIYYPPYDLACFAAGFQDVIIPYKEFHLEIDLAGAKDIHLAPLKGMY